MATRDITTTPTPAERLGAMRPVLERFAEALHRHKAACSVVARALTSGELENMARDEAAILDQHTAELSDVLRKFDDFVDTLPGKVRPL
jgi:hypothetical protein